MPIEKDRPQFVIVILRQVLFCRTGRCCTADTEQTGSHSRRITVLIIDSTCTDPPAPPHLMH